MAAIRARKAEERPGSGPEPRRLTVGVPGLLFEIVELTAAEDHPHCGPAEAVLVDVRAVLALQVGVGARETVEWDPSVHVMGHVDQDVVDEQLAQARTA